MKRPPKWVILGMILCIQLFKLKSFAAITSGFCDFSIETVEIVHPTDCGSNDGWIEILVAGNINGIILEYTLDGGVSWQENNVFLNLPAGAYGVGVRSIEGICPVFYPEPVELLGPDSPRFIEVATTDPTNCGLNDGSLTVYAEGGTGPYHYSIDNGITWQMSNMFNNLQPGIYQPIVKNLDGTCPTSYVLPITVNSLTPPLITEYQFQSPSDCGTEDGIIQISAMGDEPTLYSIDGGLSWQTSGEFFNLPEGSYQIVMQNANGTCLVSGETIELISPIVPAVSSVEITHPSDCLENNGEIAIQLLNSETEIQFSIDDGVSWDSEPVFHDLPAGNYPVLIKNADGTCGEVDVGTVNLIDPPEPQIISVQFQNPSDCFFGDGFIEIEATGGFGQLEFSHDGGLSWTTNSNFPGLTAGTYLPGVRNQDGTCQGMAAPVVLADPLMPEITFVSSQDPSDCMGDDGSLIVLASEGEGSTLFSIDNGFSWHSIDWFTGLSEGTYLVLAKNMDGTCISYPALEILLSDPESPVIMDTQIQPPGACGINDGFIEIVTGLNNVYHEYSIDGGQNWQLPNSFHGLGPGIYELRVRNQNGNCITEGETIIFDDTNSPEVQEIVFLDPTNCGTNDGQIYILTEISNAQYSIDGGISWQNNGAYQNLGAGIFNVQIRIGESGCIEDLGAITLSAPSQITIEEVQISRPSSCSGDDGEILIISEPDSDPLEFSIDAGQSWHAAPLFSNLGPGFFTVIVRNVYQTCESNEYPVELEPLALSTMVDVSIFQPDNCYSSNGQIDFIFTQSENSCLVSIDGGSSWSQEGQFDQLAAGMYSIWLSNIDGSCPEFLGDIELIAQEVPVISDVITSLEFNCDQSLANVEILMEDEGEFEYSIDGGNSWHIEPFFTDLPPGTYLPVVRKINGNCLVESNPIIVPTPFSDLEVAVVESQPSDCHVNDGRIEIITEGPGAPLEFSIDGGDSWQTSAFFENLAPGNFQLRVKSNLFGCEIALSEVILEYPETPEIVEMTSQDLSGCNTSDGQIIILANGGVSIFQYSIDGGMNWQGASGFFDLPGGFYSVMVRNADGSCSTMADELIHIQSPEPPPVNEIVLTDVSDCQTSDGYIAFIGDFSGNEIFSIDGGQNWSVEPEFDSLQVGNYDLQLLDEFNLCLNDLGTFDVQSPDQPVVDSIIVVPTTDCFTNNGEVLIFPGGDNTVLEYSIDGNSWQIEPFFLGLSSGPINMWIRNADGTCLYNPKTVNVGGFSAPEILEILSFNPQSCFDDDGQITILTSPGADTFEYSIDGGINWEMNSTFNGLEAGFYHIKVRVVNTDCEVNYPQLIILESFDPVALDTLEWSNPTCSGFSDAEIMVEATGGLAPYNYYWSNGQSGETLSGVPAGNYALYLTDARGCSKQFKFKIEPVDSIGISLGKDIDTTLCLGQNLVFELPDENLNYQWNSDNGFESNASSVIFSEPGKYWVTAENQYGCQSSDTINFLYLDAFFDSDFLLPVEGIVNMPIIMIDISWPVPDSISWVFENQNISLIQFDADQQIVQFDQPKTYTFGMKAYSGACYGYLEKEIRIVNSPEELTQEDFALPASNVLEFKLSPNPNQGDFNIEVMLEESASGKIWLVDSGGNPILHRYLDSAPFHLEFFSIELDPGVYTIILETGPEWHYLNFVLTN